MLSSMKGVRMAGLTEKLSSIIQNFRAIELKSASGFRMMLVYTLSVGRSPSAPKCGMIFELISQLSYHYK